jgi:DUF1680 family protein
MAGAAVVSRVPASRLLAAATPQQDAVKLQTFSYGAAKLLPGPLDEQFRYNQQLFLNLSEDSLLKPFRQAAGLAAPGEDMGGWYSYSDKFDPPKNMTGYIPGHTFGQYLSGLARAYAVTGDAATKAKVERLVAGFAPTVTTNFYKGYCLPSYTFEKTMCGLSDAYAIAGVRSALPVLDKATDAALPWLPPKALNREEMAARPHPNVSYTWDESYTLPENFYLAYKRGAGARYRTLAQRFLQDDTYFNPLAEGKNVLPGQHAYSHVNALCSAMQAYLNDGSTKHLRAAQNGFRYVLEQSFATGGWGPGETFVTPGSDQLAKSLEKNHNSFETPCGAYGHFKITRYLLSVTGDSSYGDSMERVLYNAILAARPLRPDGISFYYADYSMDAAKVDYEQKWPCCSGTFPQLTADYGLSAYFHDASGVYVNLYIPSRLAWKQGGAQVELEQRTEYPYDNNISMRLKMSTASRFALALRIPAWATGENRLLVNGKDAGVAVVPGTWAKVQREWRDGDRVELSCAFPAVLEPLDAAHRNLVALKVGPLVLFAIQPGDAELTQENLLKATRMSSRSKSWKVNTAKGDAEMRPFDAITTERYRLYQKG